MRKALFLIALAVAAAVGYIALVKPYVKDASYIATAPDTAMAVFTFVNPTPFTVCITGAEVLKPPGVLAELHVTEINGTLVAMRPIDKVCAAPFSAVKFTHFGYHLMLTGNITGDVEIRLRLSNGEDLVFAAARTQLEIHIH